MSKAVIFSAAQSVLMLAALGFVVKQQFASAKPAEVAAAVQTAEEHASSGAHEAEASRSDRHGSPPKREDGEHGVAAPKAAPAKEAAEHGEPASQAASGGGHAAPTKSGGASQGHEAHAGGGSASVDPTEIANELLAGNARFVSGASSMHQWGRERQRVQATQHPKAMVLSCSDSRVPPEHIFDQGLGDLFVVRTAGNIADAIAVGSLEYAAEHLHSKVLIVLGHERCGAVTAAASGQKMPTKNLDAIVKKIAPAVAASSGWSKGPALVHMAAENNVARTADDLLKQSPVLRKAVAEGHLTILRAMYDLDSGKVTPLP